MIKKVVEALLIEIALYKTLFIIIRVVEEDKLYKILSLDWSKAIIVVDNMIINILNIFKDFC